MKTKLLTFILLLALLFVPTASAHAQSPNGDDVLLIGQNYTLNSDETLNGSLVVIGGNALIEDGAVVDGDIVLIGGNLTIHGEASGNIALIGGNLSISGTADGDIAVVGGQAVLTKTAKVNGDIATIGGQVEKEPGAEVSGDITNNAPLVDIPAIPDIPNIPNVPDAPNSPNVPDVPNVDLNINPLWEVVNVIWRALAIAAIGMLITLFLQPQLERVADTVTHQPLMAGSFGLLTIVGTILAVPIMSITIILIPVAVMVILIVPLGWLFGIIALGQEVGERFTKAINQTWAPVLSTGFGTFLLLLVGGFVGLIPCVGWLAVFLIGLMAVGGVATTWFGTRSAPGAIMPQPVEIPPAS
jgi:hypothetical protein